MIKKKSNFHFFFFCIFKTPIKASCGISTLPNCFDLAFPFFVFLKVFFFYQLLHHHEFLLKHLFLNPLIVSLAIIFPPIAA